jgi:hypothetical protein
MYTELTAEQYMSMTNEEQINELKKWIEDALDNHRAIIRSIAGTMTEIDEDIAEALEASFKDLATLLNSYDEDSAAYAILKYRLDHNVEDCDDLILDTDELGRIICRISLDCTSEEDGQDLKDIRAYNDNLQTFCRIFGFEALLKSLQAWCP